MKTLVNEVLELEKFVFDDSNTGGIVLDKAFELSEKKDLLAENLENLLSEKEADGLFLKCNNGYFVSISKSAKENGKWQVTNFDKYMKPISDNGIENIKDASESFFNSFLLSSLDIESLDKLEDIMRKETYLNTNFDDLKLVRVVKNIDNLSIDNDIITFNQNPNKGESIRNTVHFTLNSVVQDHAYGKFSESQYAIVADLKDTADNNKIHGLSPADTFFWGDDFKLKDPTIFMPKGDENIDLYSNNFTVIEYEKSTNEIENYQNLKNAVADHFNEKELPFNELGMWNWSGFNAIPDQEQKDLSEYLGSGKALPTTHESSLDAEIEKINSSLIVLDNYLDDVRNESDLKVLDFSFGEEIEKNKKSFFETIEEIKLAAPHSVDHYNLIEEKLKLTEINWKEKIEVIFPIEKETVSVPPPLPVNDFNNFCTNPEINQLINKHLNLTDENKEKRFFLDDEDALEFYKNNFKEIEKTIEMQANSCGYLSKSDFMKDSPYFNKFDKEDLEKAFIDQNNRDLNIELSNYSIDTLNFDKNYFEDAQNNVLESYSTGELYIILSDESSQAFYVKDNMFMDDQDSEMSAKLNQVFDNVEQVENLLEVNESLIQDKINRINLMDNRNNPNVNTIKALAQGKLNYVKGELSEIKSFNSHTLTPIGENKQNVIMLDSNNDNLYSISKSKLIGTNKDIAEIIKSNKPIELFNNGDKIEIKGYNHSEKEISKEIKNSMELH